MVEHLFEKKRAKAIKWDKVGRSALHMAALFTDEEEKIKLLLSVKIKVEDCGISGMTALYCASIASDDTVATHLIDHGADFRRLDQAGHSSLDLAACFATDTKILELLLIKVEIEQCDSHGITALYSTAMASNAIFARYMIERGANINQHDIVSRTLVHNAKASVYQKQSVDWQ